MTSWDWGVPPGEVLREALGERRMTQAELARRMGRPASAINEIINGKKILTAQTAIELEQVLGGISAGFWLSLEAQYREYLARQRQVRA